MSLNVELLEQSFERIKPRAEEFAASFYENLFQLYPEVKPLFAKTDMANQQKKLLNSLVLVVENLRNPEALGPVLNALGGRHIGYGATANYYPAIGKVLLSTFEQYLQQDWTSEVKQAWTDAYNAITALMLKGAGTDHAPQEVQLKTQEISDKEGAIAPVITAEQQIEEVPEEELKELPVELLESSFEKVKPRAEEFAASFYEQLFISHPEVKPLFAKTDMANQQKKLLNSLVLVVENLRNPEALGPVLNALGGRHVGYGAIANYYPAVGKALLSTFEQYLQQDWTPQVKQAWTDAFKTITALMLKGAGTDYAPQEVQLKIQEIPDKEVAIAPAILAEPQLDEKEATIKKSRESNAERPNESEPLQTQVEQQKKPLILIQLDTEILKQIQEKIANSYQQFQVQLSKKQWGGILKQILEKIIGIFWTQPAWLIATVSAFLFIVVYVSADDNSLLAEVLESADALSLVIGLILFIKEAPDRRKQFHYQAWSTIDAAHDVKVSYARILALQDLNEEKVSLRGLNAPGAELVDINLPNANLSEANLNKTDFSNANLSHANLDNAILSHAKLSGANLSHAKLSFARLNKANLSSVNFSSANLICANLSNANLSGANLKNASLSGANPGLFHSN